MLYICAVRFDATGTFDFFYFWGELNKTLANEK